MQDELRRKPGGAEVGDQENSRPMGKWRSPGRCLPIRAIPFQRFVQPLGSPVPLCTDTSKRLNRSPNCQNFRSRNSKIYTQLMPCMGRIDFVEVAAERMRVGVHRP